MECHLLTQEIPENIPLVFLVGRMWLLSSLVEFASTWEGKSHLQSHLPDMIQISVKY
jgi:hypothetical protein